MDSTRTPVVSIILPVFNEQALLRDHVMVIAEHLRTLEEQFSWEVLLINDGSTDDSGEIADALASELEGVRVLHHPCNFGLGQALKFGFANTRGDYVVTMDVDLSYDVNHIEELLHKLISTHAKIVLASPYMEGGQISNVPFLRKSLSILGNKFLSIFVRGHFSTLTSMVRVFDGPFIRALNLRSMGMDVMPEMLYKGMVVRAKIEEAPGRLDWGPQRRYGDSRVSSMRVLKHVYSTIASGFLFRPMLFFILPGLGIGLFSLYVNFWMLDHFFNAWAELKNTTDNPDFDEAFAVAFAKSPHTFLTALLSAMLAIQMLGLGIITAQNKRYFEDLYHLNSSDINKLKVKADDK